MSTSLSNQFAEHKLHSLVKDLDDLILKAKLVDSEVKPKEYLDEIDAIKNLAKKCLLGHVSGVISYFAYDEIVSDLNPLTSSLQNFLNDPSSESYLTDARNHISNICRRNPAASLFTLASGAMEPADALDEAQRSALEIKQANQTHIAELDQTFADKLETLDTQLEEAGETLDKILEAYNLAANATIAGEYKASEEALESRAASNQRWGLGLGFLAFLIALSPTLVAVIMAIFGLEDSSGKDTLEQLNSVGAVASRTSAAIILASMSGYFFSSALRLRNEAKRYRQTSILSISLNGFSSKFPETLINHFRFLVGMRLFRLEASGKGAGGNSEDSADSMLKSLQEIADKKEELTE